MNAMQLRVVDERRERFARVRDANVLIYWPHGLGDWAFLSYVLPLLEPSNRYWVTRYGDDYVALFDRNPHARPVYTGVNGISDGSAFGARHLGIDWKRIDGRIRAIDAPLLNERIARDRFDVLLYTDFPEPEGRARYPFHTKARNVLRELTARHRRSSLPLDQPLRSSIVFEVDDPVRRDVEDRLRRFVEPDEELVLLTCSGHTQARKNWELAEAACFVEMLLRERPKARVLVFGEAEGLQAAGYREIFGDLSHPFALVLKVLVARAVLAAGVPAGPLHVALAHGGVPVVGIWQAHHPDWHEERSEHALHLLGGYVLRRGFDRRPATRTLPEHLRNRTRSYPRDEQVPARAALDAAISLIAAR